MTEHSLYGSGSNQLLDRDTLPHQVQHLLDVLFLPSCVALWRRPQVATAPETGESRERLLN